MAFKFKVKKRPSLAQAAAGGFAQGVATGINQAAQLSLQDRLRKQEEEKNRLKKELDLFNGMISDVELTQANRETIMRGKRMIIASDGKTGASTVYSSVSPDKVGNGALLPPKIKPAVNVPQPAKYLLSVFIAVPSDQPLPS